MIKLFQHTYALRDITELDGEYELGGFDPAGYYLLRRIQLSQNNLWTDVVWEKELHSTALYNQDSYKANLQTETKHLKDGGFTFSSGIEPRTIEIEGTIHEEDPAVMEAWEDKLKAWARRPFLKLQYRDDRYFNLGEFQSFDWVVTPARSRSWATFRCSWRVDDPFSYSMTQTVFGHAGGTDFITVTNGSEDRNQSVFPTISLSGWPKHDVGGGFPPVYQNNGAAYFQNQSFFYNKSFNLTAPIFGLQAETELCGETGDVFHFNYPNVGRIRDQATAFYKGDILDGDPFVLVPGSNTIYYAGNPTYVCFCFRERFL